MLASPMFKVGNYPNDTSLTLVQMFNRSVLLQGTSYAFPGRSFNSCLKRSSVKNLGWSDGLFQAHGFSRGVSDILQLHHSVVN